MNIKNCIFILLSLLLIINRLKAQDDFSMNHGPKMEIEDGEITAFFDQDDENFYFLRTGDKQYIEFNTNEQPGIEVFDRNLTHQKFIPLRIESEEKYRRLQPLAFYKTRANFVFLCKYYSSANQIVKAYLFKTDPDGEVIGGLTDLGEINDISPLQEDFHYFQLHRIKKDTVTQFIFSLTTSPDMEVPERINFIIFDEQLNVTGNRLINFPDDMLDYEFSEQLASQEGQVFFRVEISNPFIPDLTVHQLIIYDIFKDEHRSYEFKLEQGKIKELALTEMEKNRIGLFGYYTKNSESNRPKGVIYYVFKGGDGTLLRQNISDLPPQSVDKFNRRELGSKSGFNRLKAQSIHLIQNNHLLLLFEFNWRSMMLIQDQEQKIYKKPYYNANEIVILNFNVENNFENLGIVNKQQTLGITPEVLGFFSTCRQNHLFLLFNDHPKNLNRYRPGKVKTMKTRYEPVIVEYFPEGATYIKQQLSTGKQEMAFVPGNIFKIDENRFLILNQDGAYWLTEITFMSAN